MTLSNYGVISASRSGIHAMLTALLCFALFGPIANAQRTWHVEVVDDGHGEDVGKYNSFVIDHTGNFHICYYNENHGALLYAYRGVRDKQWFIMQVDKQGGQFASLAVDSHDRPHLAYNSRNLTGLHYSYWNGTQWQTQIIDHDRTNHFTSLQVDAQGYPHISYYQEENADRTNALHLKYAFFDGKTWYIETVSRKFGTGKFNSIALDSSGRPHIAYSIVVDGDLGYVSWDGSNWVYEIPDTRRTHNNYVGQGNSIALDSHGFPHIAYFDLNSRAIKYTRWTPSGWQIEVVDKVVGNLAQADRLSLKIDSHDHPHIAYYDSAMGTLKYAERSDKGWHSETVDQGSVGEYPSLSLNNQDEPYIAYYDAGGGGQLRIAHPDSSDNTPKTTKSENLP